MYESIGVVVRQRPEQHRVDDAEDRRVGADPKGKGQHGDSGEAGCLEKGADRVPQVAHDIVEPPKATLIPMHFPHLLDSAEVASRRLARRLRRPPTTHVFVCLQLEMLPNVLFQRVLVPAPTERSKDACEQNAHG